MFKMARSLHEARDAVAREEMEMLGWKYGPEVLSSSYNKVGRLVQHCPKVATAGQGIEVESALVFLVQTMDCVVATGKVRS